MDKKSSVCHVPSGHFVPNFSHTSVGCGNPSLIYVPETCPVFPTKKVSFCRKAKKQPTEPAPQHDPSCPCLCPDGTRIMMMNAPKAKKPIRMNPNRLTETFQKDFKCGLVGKSIPLRQLQQRGIGCRPMSSYMFNTPFKATPSPIVGLNFEQYRNIPPPSKKSLPCKPMVLPSTFRMESTPQQFWDPHKYAFKWGGMNTCPPCMNVTELENRSRCPKISGGTLHKKVSKKFKDQLCENIAKCLRAQTAILSPTESNRNEQASQTRKR